MICSTCRRSMLSQLRTSYQRRAIATTPSTSYTASSVPGKELDSPPAAISSNQPGKSQPFSTPFFPSTSTAKIDPTIKAKDVKKPVKLRSSIAGGVELRGLGYTKAKPQILAEEDDQYPEWLWKLLDSKTTAEGGAKVDLIALSKKQRQKYERKQARLMKDVPKPIPLHEQSKDLTQPGDDALISLERRQELTKSSREARRKGIRESNFLRGM